MTTTMHNTSNEEMTDFGTGEPANQTAPTQRRPWLAAALSLMLPGLGQLYNGRVHLALWVFMLFTLVSIPGLMLSALYLPEWMMLPTLTVCVLLTLGIWIYAVTNAYLYARREPRSPREAWQTTGLYVLIFLVCHFLVLPTVIDYIRQHQAQAFRIPSASMSPTILPGDYLFADMRYNCPTCVVSVDRGDVVILINPNNRNQYHIKRIIGLPGDEISIESIGVTVNGQELYKNDDDTHTERFGNASWSIVPSIHGRASPEPDSIDIKVPDGMVFVLGDNRIASKDSRDYGPLPLADVVGKARQIWFSSDGGSLRWGRIGRVIHHTN